MVVLLGCPGLNLLGQANGLAQLEFAWSSAVKLLMWQRAACLYLLCLVHEHYLYSFKRETIPSIGYTYATQKNGHATQKNGQLVQCL